MKRVIIWISLLFIFTIPLSQYLSVRLLLLLVLLSVFVFKAKIFPHVFRQSWDLLLYLIVLVIGLIYSEDKMQGLRVLETSFSLAAIGFVFYGLLSGSKNIAKYSLDFFSVGVLIACLVIAVNSLINYLKVDSIDVFQYYELTYILGLQPTYIAGYVILSITYLIFVLYYNSKISKLLLTISALFLFAVLLLSGGKTTFISLMLIFSFFFLKYLLDYRSPRKTYAIILVSLMMVAFLLISSSEYFNNISADKTDSWERSVLWRSAIKANPSPLFGVGTGDYKLVLNQYYTSQGLAQFAIDNYNSHNQFIQLYFSNGIFGLIVFLTIIGRPLYLSFKSQNPLGILIMFPFVMYGMTEVFLSRYQGVVFFALCHQIIISQYYSSKYDFVLKAS